MGYGELAWSSGGSIDDSGNVNVECGETLCTGNEETVGSEDCEWAFVSIGIRWYTQKKGRDKGTWAHFGSRQASRWS